MPRPKGSKVVVCPCGARIVGMPGTRKTCSFCKKRHTIPKIKTKAKGKAKSKAKAKAKK